MARTISLGQRILTKLRNYHWEVVMEKDDSDKLAIEKAPDSKLAVKVYEVYNLTDDDYGYSEPQQRKPVTLTTAQQATLNSLLVARLTKAAKDEQVDPE